MRKTSKLAPKNFARARRETRRWDEKQMKILAALLSLIGMLYGCWKFRDITKRNDG